MARKKRSRSNATMVKLAELAVEAPQVVAIRSAQMLAPAFVPGVRDSAELSRMVTEKAAASCEALVAVTRQLLLSQQEYTRGVMTRALRLWMTPWWLAAFSPAARATSALPAPVRALMPTRRERGRAASQLAAAALAPVHRRVRANAKRLTRANRKRPR